MEAETVDGGALDDQYRTVFCDASRIVDVARSEAARSVNAAMTAAYWMIGQRIVVAYGDALLARLAVDLTRRFGRSLRVRTFSKCANSTSLFGWIRFARQRLANLPAPPMNEFSRRCLENLNPPVGSILCAQKDDAVARAREALRRRGLPPAADSP